MVEFAVDLGKGLRNESPKSGYQWTEDQTVIKTYFDMICNVFPRTLPTLWRSTAFF